MFPPFPPVSFSPRAAAVAEWWWRGEARRGERRGCAAAAPCSYSPLTDSPPPTHPPISTFLPPAPQLLHLSTCPASGWMRSPASGPGKVPEGRNAAGRASERLWASVMVVVVFFFHFAIGDCRNLPLTCLRVDRQTARFTGALPERG